MGLNAFNRLIIFLIPLFFLILILDKLHQKSEDLSASPLWTSGFNSEYLCVFSLNMFTFLFPMSLRYFICFSIRVRKAAGWVETRVNHSMYCYVLKLVVGHFGPEVKTAFFFFLFFFNCTEYKENGRWHINTGICVIKIEPCSAILCSSHFFQYLLITLVLNRYCMQGCWSVYCLCQFFKLNGLQCVCAGAVVLNKVIKQK